MTQWHTLQQDWGENQTRRRNEGEEGREKKSGAGCAPKNQGEKQRGKRGAGERGEGGGNDGKTGASHLCPHVLQPCHHAMLLREEWGWWWLCASMSMPMRGNVIHGISCHHDELFVCQCVLQPAIPVCMSVCVCVCREHVSAGSRSRSTQPKKKKRECVCVRRERGKQPAK